MLAPLASGTVAGTGSAGYVPVWTSGNAVTYDSTASNMLMWDLTNHRLGIGTTTPSTLLHVVGASTFGGTVAVTGAVTASSTIAGATGVGIGTASVAASSVLDMVSTTKGFLPPRMTTTQRDAVSSPAEGLTVYNTTTDALNVYTGSAWAAVGSGTDLDSLSDVTITSATNADIIQYNGSAWVNTPLVSAVAGDAGPSFSVYQGSNQTINPGAVTTLTWASEVFDTNNNFASNKCTPTVAGKYILTLNVAPNTFGSCSAGAGTTTYIRKNSTTIAYNTLLGNGTNANGTLPFTVVADANGSTDYFDAAMYTSCAGAWVTQGTTGATVFTGGMLAPLASGTVAGTGSAGYLPVWTSGNAITYDSTASNMLMWDLTNHRLGIGTTAPSTLLHVVGASTFGGTVAVTGAVTASSTIAGATGVGIGTASVAASSVLDMVSTTKGFLPPRMTTTQRDAVSSPAEGLTVYNTTTDALNIYTGSAWAAVGSGTDLDSLSDVTITSAASNDILRHNGTAWVNVPINDAMTTTTMAANWPDAIRCYADGNGHDITFVLAYRYVGGLVGYWYVQNPAGSDYLIVFNSDGTYNSGSSSLVGYSTDCGRNLSVLAAAGKTFNFIGTGAVTTFDVGTAAAPGLAVTSDTDTGFYQNGTADTLGIALGGAGEVLFTATATSPVTSDGNALGTTALMWSDLFLASGAVINFNNGDVTATHAANTLAFAGASTAYSFDSGVGIGTTSVAASSLLDIVSTTKGFLPPRMTTTQRDAVSSPAEGLTIYNTTTDALNVYTGSAWGAVGGAGAIDDLSDVTISSPASSQILSYNGSAWVNASVGSVVAGVAGPSFAVHKNGTDQTVSAGVGTLVTWSTEVFDTNNNFSSNRFTPTVAGKYIVTAALRCGVSTIRCDVMIYKNGGLILRNIENGANQLAYPVATIVVDMNGSTDYLGLPAISRG